MNKKHIKFPLLFIASFLLTGCELNVHFKLFNFDSLNYRTKDFELVQLRDTLIWGPVDGEKDYTYELFSDDESLGFPVNSYSHTISKDSDIGKKYYVVAYDGNEEVARTKKLKTKEYSDLPVKKNSYFNLEGFDVPDSNGNIGQQIYYNGSKTLISDEYTFEVDSYYKSIFLTGFNNCHFRFRFEYRKDPIYIFLTGCNISSLSNSTYPIFDYDSKTGSPLFYFILSGNNVLDGGTNNDYEYGCNTISVPNAVFMGDGKTTIKGGTPGQINEYYADKNGYAVKTNNLFNLTQKGTLNIIGGDGATITKNSTLPGGKGQLPINPTALIKAFKKNTIAIRGGNGGDGGSYDGQVVGGDGGNAYSYSYLTNIVYSKYSDLFNDILGEPTPGKGGKSYQNGKDGILLTE